jgi:hypothetical protein
LLAWRARRSVRRRRWELLLLLLLAFEVHLAKERKGVVADYRFAGELRSLPVVL